MFVYCPFIYEMDILPSHFLFSLEEDSNVFMPLFFKKWLYRYIDLPKRIGILKRGWNLWIITISANY